MDSEAIKTLIAAARQGAHEIVSVPGGAPVLLTREDARVLDLTPYMDLPRRTAQVVTLLSPEDFAAYVLRFKGENSVVFADETAGVFVGVIDYHKPATAEARGAEWLSHKALYAAPFSPEWLTWTNADKQPMDQESFARFIEDNYTNITQPSHGEMIEVSRRLEVSKGVNFKSSKRLADGQVEFQYVESVDASAGSVKVPDEFILALPVFRSGVTYEVRARLRYRLAGSQLTMWFELIRPDRVRDHAMTEVTKVVRGLLDEVPLYLGGLEHEQPKRERDNEPRLLRR
jgi:uncharacterized protein YfdQ (DUF2303 family)